MDYDDMEEICSKMLTALFNKNADNTISFLQEWISDYDLENHFQDEDKFWDENECWDGIDLDEVSDEDLLQEIESRNIVKVVGLEALTITQENFLNRQIERVIKREII